jgi:uronate dehydrogenase
MSNNAVTWWDNAQANHIGFKAQDSSDVFRDAVYARTTEPDLTDPAVQFQGGGFVKQGPF